MRIHSLEKIERLKKLRKAGYSIEELVRILSIPKTTIWHHIQGIKLSQKYILKLRANQGGSRIRKEKDLLKATEEARQLLLNDKNRDLSIIAAALYWAEGSKRRCEFINTDGNMIMLYLSILRGHFKIPETAITPALRIFTNHNPEESLEYWSKVTKIPKRKFKIFLNDGGTSGRTKYGMCRIIVLRGGYMLKLFKAIIDQVCKENINVI